MVELRRAVKDFGFVGAMIPSNGLTRHVRHAEYWPIYEEAEKLNCIMAVHGGSYINLGFNTYSIFPAPRALGMPFPLAIALTGMMVDGVLDPSQTACRVHGGRDPWIPLVLDRVAQQLKRQSGVQIE